MKTAILFVLFASVAVMHALPAVAPAAAGLPTTTAPPGIPPAVLDLISSRLDALATPTAGGAAKPFGGPFGGAAGPWGSAAAGGPPAAVPGVSPAVAKMVKNILKTFAAPAVA